MRKNRWEKVLDQGFKIKDPPAADVIQPSAVVLPVPVADALSE